MRDGESRYWVVKKFGGTSVSAAARWGTIAAQARQGLEAGKHVLIVVSAVSGVTNLLSGICEEGEPEVRQALLQDVENLHRGLIRALDLGECPQFEQFHAALVNSVALLATAPGPAERAVVLAYGELMSSALGAQALRQRGLPALWQDARLMLTTADKPATSFLTARCLCEPDPELESRLAGAGSLHITQGFIAADSAGRTRLLGRGGSDTSAAYLAASLQAEALEIWTDVPGMFSADPRVVPDARLLNNLGYREAQELASMGAKVLHPPSILPARKFAIPLFIKDTSRPEFAGTCITARDRDAEAQVKGVVSRRGITLINMESESMWGQAGFLADAFAIFKQCGFSVDLIATSESSVTVSLDPDTAVDPGGVRLAQLLEALSVLCRVQVHADCVSISLVGNAIRTILGRIATALEVFQDRHIYMVTQSSNDLNLTLVVDAEHAESLVRKLHQLLITVNADGRPEFGPSWTELNRDSSEAPSPSPWWKECGPALCQSLGTQPSAYIYHLATAQQAAQRLRALKSIDRVLYSVKANDHPEILRMFAAQGLGFECVSFDEVLHVVNVVPDIPPADILFTPNFAAQQEYREALELGVRITVDSSWVLHEWPLLFAGREIFLRLDLNRGYGHHKKVVTSGKDSKFGIALEHLDALTDSLRLHDIRVIGLHVHTGSGVIDATVWREQLQHLLDLLPKFPDVRVLDLGGGLGVPERPRQPRFDLQQLDQLLAETLGHKELQLWLEPGRYLVAECGVLLARVTQLKTKGQIRYVGVATGMNSLLRPALYGAYHEMVNLSRMDEPGAGHFRVVGPICESGDVLGESRLLPQCHEGDIILVANTGAYGHVMSSSYNRRQPATEIIFS